MSQLIGMSAGTGISTSSEFVDDIPLLLAHLQRLGIQRLLDAQYASLSPSTGLSIGWIILIWLAHILSQSGRQPRHVRTWIASHPETLRWLTGQHVVPSDLSDARLRDALRLLDDDTIWAKFELAINQHLTRTYRIQADRIRLSHSTGLWYITSEGALQFDQSRRWWPGAMQVQLILATIDRLGVPTTVWVEQSETIADSSLEIINQSRKVLAGHRLTFVGNGELNSPAVRATIHAGNDSYLCLLSREDALAELRQVSTSTVPQLANTETPNDLFELHEPVEVMITGSPFSWVERRLLTRSHRQAEQQADDLMLRVARAQRELLALNEKKRGKRRPRTLLAMQEAAEAILDEHHVTGLIQLHFDEMVDSRTVRRYRGRPTTTRVDRMVTISSSVNETALQQARERLGWQIYATTISSEDLPLEQIVRMNNDSTPAFERMRGRSLSLLPGIIQRSDHVRGLVRLLGLGLRAYALIDLAVQAHAAELPGMVWQRPGAPISNSNPVAERILELFRDLTLTAVSDGHGHGYHLTSLSSLQRRILEWLALSSETYQPPVR
jgi:transposase